MFEFTLEKLRGIMAEKGIKQIDLADRLNISMSAINNKMLGKTEFTLREIKEISKMLCVEFIIKGWD